MTRVTLRILFLCVAALLFPAGDGALGASTRVTPLQVPAGGRAGFEPVPGDGSGLLFTNRLAAERHYANQILLNGSGVAAGDVDGDGWCDLFFCGLSGQSRLYRNLGGWKFEDVTGRTGVGFSRLEATGAALVDFDGDGDLDLIVNSVGQGSFCLSNDGKGRFETVSILNTNQCGTSMALGDVDGDGDLDLYIANYRVNTIRDAPHLSFTFREVNGRPEAVAFGGRPLTSPELRDRFTFKFQPSAGGGGGGTVLHDERGEPDAMYLNEGGGVFRPVSFTGGRFLDEAGAVPGEPPMDWGLSVAMRDLNGDGSPDLYVCNDFSTPDRIWINDGAGRFRAMVREAIRQTSLSTMGVDFADLNGDGLDDIFTADMLSRERWRRLVQKNEVNPNMNLFMDVKTRPQYPRNMLQLSRGDGTYAEVAQWAGVDASEWAWTSVFLDVDLDGREDLLVANGFERDYMNMDANRQINAMQGAAGSRLPLQERRALNRFYPRLATPNNAFRNLGGLRFSETGAEWGFAAAAVSQGMCLADLDNDGDLDVAINNLNDPAILLRNLASAPRVLVRLKGRAGNSRGIGARIKVGGGPVDWQSQEMMAGGRYLSSDDAVRVFAAGSATNRLTIEVAWRSGARTALTNVGPNSLVEIEEPPGRAEGSVESEGYQPGRRWFSDVSGTVDLVHLPVGRDDFAVQPLLPYRVSELEPGVGWRDANRDGLEELVLGSFAHGVSPLAADVDGDGDLDAFVGGRFADGRWPEPEPSVLVRDGGGPPGAGGIAGSFEEAGGVSQALFSDLDGDGDPDLVAACEWGALKLFRNEGGRFERWDVRLTFCCGETRPGMSLGEYTGRWNGVAAGDFDGDGRMDLVASNWGRNTKAESFRSRPPRIYYGELNGDEALEVIEAWYDEALGDYAPVLNIWTLSRVMPWLLTRFDTYEAFARSTVGGGLGDQFASVRWVEARSLESVVLLNRGDRFEVHPLPMEAQMAPAFGISVADFDGDGFEDLFLAQNWFGVRGEDSRHDAGRGLVLRGDGGGGFEAVPGAESGVMIYGEQRGTAVCDYDQDGRVDLAVAQFNGPVRLFRNVSARPGIRVVLKSDREALLTGAMVRLKSGERMGPAREIGSGRDSRVPVLSMVPPATGVRVRWGDGRVQEVPIPDGAREVEVSREP